MNASNAPDNDLQAGQVLRAGDLAPYQTGAVVSRTIIKESRGTVTLFSFDKGQELSEHTTPFNALVYVLEGEAEVTIAGVSRPVQGGDMLIMPAGKPHALKASERFKMMLVMIRE